MERSQNTQSYKWIGRTDGLVGWSDGIRVDVGIEHLTLLKMEKSCNGKARLFLFVLFLSHICIWMFLREIRVPCWPAIPLRLVASNLVQSIYALLLPPASHQQVNFKVIRILIDFLQLGFSQFNIHICLLACIPVSHVSLPTYISSTKFEWDFCKNIL